MNNQKKELMRAALKLEDSGWDVDFDQPTRVGSMSAKTPEGNLICFGTGTDYPLSEDGLMQAKLDYEEGA